ncbi:hypothetical protein BMWSH_3092 [Priestia megaterium WSH-002]|uniref:Uncharacterized protein n=1 Tax=Priestia megaterium (strain WSH-002) TaxID=1006007 RepID=A0A8D3WZZ0_PRIMW|nr:hypothetical protein BMWSH_3092 [Priestia megaterium WSH-002]
MNRFTVDLQKSFYILSSFSPFIKTDFAKQVFHTLLNGGEIR